MNKKMKPCFEGHTLMYGLFGLGLGVVLVVLFPGLANLWLGVILMVVAFILDWMRK